MIIKIVNQDPYVETTFNLASLMKYVGWTLGNHGNRRLKWCIHKHELERLIHQLQRIHDVSGYGTPDAFKKHCADQCGHYVLSCGLDDKPSHWCNHPQGQKTIGDIEKCPDLDFNVPVTEKD